jgi:hypothetical protein
MAFNEEQRRIFNEDYTRLTRKPVARFVCPITLRDAADAKLCDGHILNEGIQTAARKSVVQWGDIDHYYGQTVEPELIAYLNTPVASPDSLMRKGKDLTVTLPSGEKLGAFITDRPGAEAKFPRIDLVNAAGETISSPYLRTNKLDPKLQKGLKVEWLMGFTNSALAGAILKSAYLALWSILGYRYTLMAAGNHLREPLAKFFNDRATKENAFEYFGKFNKAVMLIFNEVEDNHYNTIKDGWFWIHFRKDGPEDERVFAVSCLFSVNKRMIIVTVPYCPDSEKFQNALTHYEVLLEDRTTPQDIFLAHREGEGIGYGDLVSVQYGR